MGSLVFRAGTFCTPYLCNKYLRGVYSVLYKHDVCPLGCEEWVVITVVQVVAIGWSEACTVRMQAREPTLGGAMGINIKVKQTMVGAARYKRSRRKRAPNQTALGS
jgi:hypothetical protein